MTKKAFILLSAAVLFTAACQGAAKSDAGSFDSAFMGGGSNGAVTAAVQETAAASYDLAMEEGYFSEDMWETAAAPPEGMEEDTAGFSGFSSPDIQSPSSLTRKLIRSVYMNVETDSFDALISQIQSKITELSGYTEHSDISGSSLTYNNIRPDRYASITARIPAHKLDAFIAAVEGSGNVTNRSESTRDVTLQYSDLESRKKTLAIEQERIWALLEKADTLEAVIALEEHLSKIRYELESMESQLKLYDNQVAYSTIEISVHEVLPVDFTPTVPETVPQRIQKGFIKNVNQVSQFLTDLLVGIVAGIPLWLPLLAALALMIIIARRIFKKNGSVLFRERKSAAGSFDPPADGTSLTLGKDSKDDSPS